MVDMETDSNHGYLATWPQCHTDTVAAVDINTAKQQVSVQYLLCLPQALAVSWQDEPEPLDTSAELCNLRLRIVSCHRCQWQTQQCTNAVG